MKKRNARLVDLADCCFCYWDGRQRCGTGQTVRMAIEKNIEAVDLFCGLRRCNKPHIAD